MNSEYCLEIKNSNKTFPGVKALDNANFKLKQGSIHALVGENGAGKSTLIKLITGVYKPESGEILINDEKTNLNSPNDAMLKGVSVVHQERNLIRRFSVGENLMLNNLPKNSFNLIDYNEVSKQSKKWLNILDLDIDPETIVSDLTVAKMQLCEIAKALSMQSKILLLDEPTSSLSPQDVGILAEAPFKNFFLSLLMSHRACAEMPLHPLNGAQLGRFREVFEILKPNLFKIL